MFFKLFFTILVSVGVVAGQCELDGLGHCIESQHPNAEFCNYFIQCTTNAELTCDAIDLSCPHEYVYDNFICSVPDFATTCPGIFLAYHYKITNFLKFT